MFRGVSQLNLDSKGRIAIPAKYREELRARCEGRLVVTVDADGCLLIYPLPEWERIEEELYRLPGLNRQARRLQRLLIGHAEEQEMDAQGRILIPAPHREYAQLGKRGVLIGQGRKFELWDEHTWNEGVDAWVNEERGEDDNELAAALGSLSF